ncbi:phage virion morphogenesis protein [Pararhodospirillum photometricum]|uniref:Phage virion morphogenesis protein n=1 Tax=Pararhodospirillum photometricum DSM 122 TaxID=1150469 RepID=H6SND7_PARPM|nr:phage virion morphogenesis protein [Pararhodospirillum photometricum]CCG09268.1 Phage virion morphogenesis protein [Pararhodospirillum photometricum DSM 122]
MAGVSISLTGADLVTKGFDGLLARVGDMTPAWASVGGMLKTSVDRRFELGLDPDGNPWPPSVRALAEGHTLVERGHLRDSVTQEAQTDRVVQGSALVYARIHQLGGTVLPKTGKRLRFRLGDAWVSPTSVTLPARPYLGANAEDTAQAAEILAEWVAEGWL